MEFHVTCGRHKKLVSVNCLNSLESAICSRFNVRQPLLLQRWHDAYADWLDVEFPIADDNELQANTRLLAIPLTPPPSTSAASAATSFVVSTNNHNSNEALIECDDSLPSDTALSSCLPQQQQQASPPPPLSVSLSLPLSLLPPPPPPPQQPPHQVTVSTPTPTQSPTPSVDCSAPASADQPSNWPSPFVIPVDRFDPSLSAAVFNAGGGGALSRDELTRLLDILFQQIRQYTFYPKTSQYAEVAEALLSLYPQLDEGLPPEDALSLWKNRLSQKFRNCRKRGVGFTDEEKARFYARRPPTAASSVASSSGNIKRIKLAKSSFTAAAATAAISIEPSPSSEEVDDYDGRCVVNYPTNCTAGGAQGAKIGGSEDNNAAFGSEFRNSELLNGIGAFGL